MILATRVALAVSLVSFVIANGLGLALGTGLLGYQWRPAHAHLNLVGFVTSMIYGVAYHAVPRFRGVPFRRPRLALAQVIVHTVGLIGMILGFGFVLGPVWFGVSGSLTWLASMVFAGMMVEVLFVTRRMGR